MVSVIPHPVSLIEHAAEAFTLTPESRLVATGGGAAAVAAQLADWLRVDTGLALPVVDGGTGTGADAVKAGAHDVVLALTGGSAETCEDLAWPETETYSLTTDASGAWLGAAHPAGLFAAAQTLRQLVPAPDAAGAASDALPAAAHHVPSVTINDSPRFAYRGAMLDVARHFFPVADVERFIDAIAMLKINHLHLHLTDDQGWRIQIDSWPLLTEIGSASETGDGPGGFYTKEDYAGLVAYAAERFVTIVPEIDIPGHTNAALASYAELNEDGVLREPYRGIEVGFTSLAINKDSSYRFIDDVVREVAAMTPGPYLHLGGDESLTLTQEQFVEFINRATAVAAATGKTLVGWHEMGQADALPTGTIGQYWGRHADHAKVGPQIRSFVEQGGSVIMSPAEHSYLDMHYPDETRLGQGWAGTISLADSYEWDPATLVEGITEAQLLGVEAPVWTETLETSSDVEFMVFPRLACVAEIAWSQVSGPRRFEEIAPRLAAFCARLDRLGINFHRSPELGAGAPDAASLATDAGV
ncbi:hexosaminidase [Arthrobacter stackebrandtii]|uniref:beta-N-acetylhexosaminidase n=1 Tax=Arthrobacter stackebrandtii TaxID=272161 RepID=A0ABS4YZ42_9MICC|nr:family 20 glycosylhydrolase [Arthrobacter stackebrandtii]MBP2414006.1 hexosaminidase [Arthrobacter stackebrandtii]PYG99015.1 beta-N-acetylhexosaminidase [Arthrobacter stackebrandtii]